MENDHVISVVVVCDDHLVVMLAALLMSIERSHQGHKRIQLYIVNDGIGKKNVDRINQIITSEKIDVVWKSIAEAIPADTPLPLDQSSYPLCIYVRLFISHFLPKDVQKVIYLDVDTLVIEDVEELWNTDIELSPVAAVTDRAGTVSCFWNGVKNYEQLGLHPNTRYFNTGVLVIDLEKWRTRNTTQLVLDTVRDNKEYAAYPDQYGLNVVFANDNFVLDSRWNNFAEGSNEDPFIIHFSGLKPLFKGYKSNLKYRELFYDHLKGTYWANYLPKEDYHSYIKKFLNMISKNSWKVIVAKSWSFLTHKLKIRVI